jgi:hypothetical protein
MLEYRVLIIAAFTLVLTTSYQTTKFFKIGSLLPNRCVEYLRERRYPADTSTLKLFKVCSGSCKVMR